MLSPMKAIFALGQDRVAVDELPDPGPQPDEVVVRIAAWGICGSEMSQYHGPAGKALTGHEAAGTVEVPDQTGRWHKGDRVVLLAIPGCGECDLCRAGHENYCPNRAARGRTWRPFGHAERIAAPTWACLTLPADMSFETAIAVGGCGIGVAWHGIQRLGVQPGHLVPVLGVGPIGLAAVMVLRHLGAQPVAVDVSPYRLDLATSFGAARTVANTSADAAEAAAAEWRAAGVTTTVLCTGNHDAARLGLQGLAPQGKLLVLGGLSAFPLDSWQLIGVGDRAIVGSWHYHRAEWPALLALVAEGLPASRLVTHTFPVSESQQAYAIFASGQTGKVVIVPDA